MKIMHSLSTFQETKVFSMENQNEFSYQITKKLLDKYKSGRTHFTKEAKRQKLEEKGVK